MKWRCFNFMKKISQKDVDYILDNIDIVDLVSEYVKLEKKGKNYIGRCPFHNEKTPSFTVSQEKKIAHCFGCGSGGNIFQFLSQIENISYNGAVVKLGNRLGLNLEFDKKKEYNLENELDLLYYSSEQIANYYNYILLNTNEASDALNYLLDRGITKETIRHFNIGYAPDNNLAVKFFESQELSLDTVVKTGIINKNDNTGQFYDMFKNRIMFPIKDDKDRVVAFSGRTLSNDKNIAKYYNTQETDIFKKREVIYNLSSAREYISKDKQLIICEGYMDVIKTHQSGVKNVVALMGTNLEENKIDYLLNLSNKILLALDNDDAGIEATLKIGNKILKNIENIYKLNFTNGKDLDEFIENRSLTDKNFNLEKYIENNKEHFLEFKINYLASKSENNIEKKINYKNELLKNIKIYNDESLRDIFINLLSEKFKIDKSILTKELDSIELVKYDKKYSNSKAVINNTYFIIEYDKNVCTLFKYFFYDRKLFLEFYNELENINFSKKIYNLLLENLIVYYNNYFIFEIHKFINDIKDKEMIKLVNYILYNNSIIINENYTNNIILDYINFIKKNNELDSFVKNTREKLKDAILLSDYNEQIKILKNLKKYKK